MKSKIEFDKLTSVDKMRGEDDEDSSLLRTMLNDANLYMQSFLWCPAITERYFGLGVGGVIAVFLFHFESLVNPSDEYLWIVVGDLPPAYLVVDEAPSPSDALRMYCALMEHWANAVLMGLSLDEAYPVDAAPTLKNAEALLTRVRFIRQQILVSGIEKNQVSETI